MAQCPSCAITESEADQLAKSTANVLRHYDIPMMDEKIADHISLAIALGGIYGTRIVNAFAQRNMNAAAKAAPVSEVPTVRTVNPGAQNGAEASPGAHDPYAPVPPQSATSFQ